jgi:hypothetical protein
LGKRMVSITESVKSRRSPFETLFNGYPPLFRRGIGVVRHKNVV